MRDGVHDIAGGGIVQGIAVAEALDEDLVPDGIRGPAWDGEVGCGDWLPGAPHAHDRREREPEADSR